jgi:hypothetical protein
VFPDESKFEKVKQSEDRVYLLEMKATEQRLFYWMQVRCERDSAGAGHREGPGAGDFGAQHFE